MFLDTLYCYIMSLTQVNSSPLNEVVAKLHAAAEICCCSHLLHEQAICRASHENQLSI